MPQPRKPSAVLEASGAFSKNPKRAAARSGEPRPIALLESVPSHLKPAAAACFREILEQAHAGVVSVADSVALEVTAELLAEFRSAPAAFSAAKLTRLMASLSLFGLTPADRSRVAALPRVQPEAEVESVASRYFTHSRRQ